MFEPPRVIAIDDDLQHLDSLVSGLQHHGVACLPVHFVDTDSIKPCPDVRVIFSDLNLIGRASDHTGQFAALTTLLEQRIAPRGPYFILLWTQFPDQAAALQAFLDDSIQDVTKPFAVRAIDKADHLTRSGELIDEGRLMAAINSLISELPQVGALFNWENKVLRAAGDTISAMLSLASTQDSADRVAEAERVLFWLGTEAVGREHVESDRFRAVNEALLPILADRIANQRSDDKVWRRALATATAQSLSQNEAARLNRMVHLDVDAILGARGGVIPLPARLAESFSDSFGVDEMTAADSQFRCRGFSTDGGRCRWVLIQAQAACDYAQSRAGPAPCYLGLEMPFPTGRSGTPPAALWLSPALEIEGAVRQLRVSATFPVSLGPGEFKQQEPTYRLREQILNDLIYHLHSHGARPGFLSFRS